MEVYNNPLKNDWDRLCKRPVSSWDEIEKKVLPVLIGVKQEGDKALKRFTEQWDGVVLDELIVSDAEIEKAADAIEPELKNALHTAAANIRKFHLIQKDPERILETMPGVLCWQKSIPIQRVGLYIPGGTAPLFSSVLMLAIPANIAGCELIQLCTPPRSDGTVHPAILYAASIAGVNKIIKVGGAQAIAAFTFGTSTVDKVDKIFGPGNQYVMAAKQLSLKYGTAIDLPAGPSEVLVMIDESADPVLVAADLLAQAEHGTDSQVVLVSTHSNYIKPVITELKKQLEELPRKKFAEKSIENSLALSFDSLSDMINFVNHYAPEHLIVSMADADYIAEKIIHAGSIFIGHLTPESVGDYASGTNHTLPTNGYARNYSGVNLDAYLKKITYQKLTSKGLQTLGPEVVLLAEAEQLKGHANAVQMRLDKLKEES